MKSPLLVLFKNSNTDQDLEWKTQNVRTQNAKNESQRKQLHIEYEQLVLLFYFFYDILWKLCYEEMDTVINEWNIHPGNLKKSTKNTGLVFITTVLLCVITVLDYLLLYVHRLDIYWYVCVTLERSTMKIGLISKSLTRLLVQELAYTPNYYTERPHWISLRKPSDIFTGLAL